MEKSFGALETLLNGLIQQGMQNNDPKITVEFRQKTIDGANVHFLAIPFLEPSWAIKDGTLFIGCFPQVVVTAMDRPADAKSISDNPDFQAALQKLNAPQQLSSVGYMDLPKTLPGSYQMALALDRLCFGICDLFGAESEPMILPPMGKIQAEMEPAASAGWSDDAGFHFRAIEPFPAASALGSAQTFGGVGVGQTALMASIALPALEKAHRQARRVQSMNNLRQIGQGIIMYAEEHQGTCPPDLGMLVTAEHLPIVVFIRPDSQNAPPPNMPADQQADWVNQHSDYVYRGAGWSLSQMRNAPRIVLCYDKDDNHASGGMNVLFLDGHVEFMTLERAHQLIEKTNPP